MNINTGKLKSIVEALKDDLGEGLVATDIWTSADALSLIDNAGHNSFPKAVALFNEVTRKLDKTLKGSEYPGLGNYYFVNLDNNRLVVVLSIGTYQQFVLLDLSKTTMGVLMSVALPNLLNSLAEEITEGLAEAKAETTAASAEAAATKPHRKQSTIREFLQGFTGSMYYTGKDQD